MMRLPIQKLSVKILRCRLLNGLSLKIAPFSGLEMILILIIIGHCSEVFTTLYPYLILGVIRRKGLVVSCVKVSQVVYSWV